MKIEAPPEELLAWILNTKWSPYFMVEEGENYGDCQFHKGRWVVCDGQFTFWSSYETEAEANAWRDALNEACDRPANAWNWEKP